MNCASRMIFVNSLLLLIVFCSIFDLPGQTYAVRDLGSQLGHPFAVANAINDKGVVTGTTFNATSTQFRGFVIEPPYKQMDVISPLSGISRSFGQAISNHSVVAAYTGSSNLNKLIIWSGGVVALIPHLTAEDRGFLWDINDAGQIVGDSADRGILYSNGAAVALPPLPGNQISSAKGINNAGVIVGISLNTGTFVNKTVKWTQGAPSEIPNLGGSNSTAYAIADNGVIVGTSDLPTGVSRAFMVLPDNTPVNLGVLPGNTFSDALATNGVDVVGYSSGGTAGERAFLYRNNQLLNLNNLIPPDSGWVLLRANGINANGQICGVGLLNGQRRAFVLTPNDGSGGAADWDFTQGLWGWMAAENIPPFEPAEAQWVPGIGYGVRATAFPCFAFLQSPELTLLPGRTYRLWCTIASTASTAEAAPQIRLRAFQTSTNMSELLALDSVGDALPSQGSKTYEFTITTQISGPAQTFRFYLDYTYFNPFDEQDAWVYLQRVLLAEN